jgi:CheY-like chemotaxis protein
MTEDVAAHVFDPFFTTKEAGKGTGLGLSTVYGVAKQSNGAVTFATSPGKGSRFSVLFPRVRDRGPIIESTRAPEGRIARGNETILVVEDQASLREVVARMLREAGYTVIETSDPEEAVQISRDHPKAIDLLLTDVIMPNITGPQLALRVLADRPKLKVLYMSGYPGQTVSPSLLLKPFSPQALAARIREVLDE